MKKLLLYILSLASIISLSGCELLDFISDLEEFNSIYNTSESINNSSYKEINYQYNSNKLEINSISEDVKLQFEYLNNVDSFVFGKNNEYNNKNSWVKTNGDNENLTVSFKVTTSDYSVINNKIRLINFEAYTTNNNELKQVEFDGKYRVNGIVQKDKNGNELTLLNLPELNKEYTFNSTTIDNISLSFSWGNAFNNLNPMKYYNSLPYSENLYDEALNKINALEKLLENISFKATFDYLKDGESSKQIVDNITYKQLKINFLELGSATTGDSTYIKAGETDILIDAGSEQSSAETIINYVNQYCTDGKLEYVITTHAHEDHWAGMFGKTKLENGSTPKNYKGEKIDKTGIYYYYDIGTIIDFALTNKEETTGNNQYYYYRQARDYAISNGAKHYTAAECFNNENGANKTYILDETNNITLDILYNKYYFEKSSDENNYSVCNMITYNNYNYMFTGDLEKEGEEAMANYYNGTSIQRTLPQVELFKAGHHGSKTSSNDCLLSIIKPKICCVCCCAGTTEYTFELKNTFPTQDFIDRIAKYTDRVYVTSVIDEKQSRKNGELTYKSLNGIITISSDGIYIGINASNNTIKLKDSEWFNGFVYVDENNRLYASGDKKYNYYDENDSNTTKTVRRVWPNK